MTLRSSIPPSLYQNIVGHLLSKCRSASTTSWERNSREEAITAAFFQDLSKEMRSDVDVPNWNWGITYRTFCPQTEEPHLGADGMFQINVLDKNNKVKFRKGLIYQCKKSYNVRNNKTVEQLKNIERHVPNSSVLIVLNDDKYSAIKGTTFIDNTSSNIEQDLCVFLTERFLPCTFGIQNLYFDFKVGQIIHNNHHVPITPANITSVDIKAS